MYRSREKSVIAILLLTIITCGFYFLYWMYQTSVYLNDVSDEYDINPGLTVVFTLITCGLYVFYWYYQVNRMSMDAKRKLTNIHQNDNYIVYLLLILFGFSWVAMLILQSDLNNLWKQISEKRETYSSSLNQTYTTKKDDGKWSDF